MEKIANEFHENTKKKNKECTQTKHFVCQFNGCNNRCDGKHDCPHCYDHHHPYDCPDHCGYYDPPVYHADDTKCEKCGVDRFSHVVYSCNNCGHYYCIDCCFI
ncbi:unnamed protein product [Rotaria magnacalcarata]